MTLLIFSSGSTVIVFTTAAFCFFLGSICLLHTHRNATIYLWDQCGRVAVGFISLVMGLFGITEV